MSSPLFTSGQTREQLPAEDFDDLSSNDSLYEDSAVDADHDIHVGKRRRPAPVKECQPDSALENLSWNRHEGSASFWLSKSALDRGIVTSLDQVQAQDLNLHLYNAYALKRRAKLAKLRPEEEREEGALWEPPRLWTAWPLPSDQVPPVRKRVWDDLEAGEPIWQSLERATGPSAELGEILMGVVLKTARERFLAENFQHDANATSATKRPSSAGNASRSRSRATSTAPSEPETTISTFSHGSEPDSDDPDTGPSSKPTNPDLPTDTEGEATHAEAAHSSPTPFDDPRLKLLSPVIMADEETAASILQPSIRHILSDLDALLTGLHHARRASLRIHDDSASGTQTDRDEAHTSRSRSRSKGQKPSAARRQKPTASKAVDPHASSSSSGESPEQPPPKRTKKRSSPRTKARSLRQKRARAGLRDWSDVLGIAAMQGWDRQVVDAAARRCAALFGEGMDFRVLGVDIGNEEYSILP